MQVIGGIKVFYKEDTMFNFRDKKKKRIITSVIVILLVLCMILPLFGGIVGMF